MSKNPASKGKF